MQDIPPWSVDGIIRQLEGIFFEVKNDNVINTIQCEMRMMLAVYCPVNYKYKEDFRRDLKEDSNNGSGEVILTLLDVAVKYIRDYAPRELDTHHDGMLNCEAILDAIEGLLENGSKWTVLRTQNSESGLIERINPEMTEIAQKINNDFLTKAWNQAFQLRADPEGAVESAQRAIESIASDRGLTKATSRVYGTLLGDIKANPHCYFSKAREAYALHNSLAKQSKDKLDINKQFANWFWSGMDLIQKTNPARHASNAVKDFKLSAEAAQQAVIIATMISWFIESGSFAKEEIA